MAGSLNKVMLIGNLGFDPEIRSMQSGSRVANLSLATSESWKDRETGERRERTEWHRVVIFNEGLIKIAQDYLRKGTKIYIEGQLETRKWTDQNGVEKYRTEIVLRPYRGELTIIDSRAAGGSSGDAPAAAGRDGGTSASTPPQDNTVADDLDDEIPF